MTQDSKKLATEIDQAFSTVVAQIGKKVNRHARTAAADFKSKFGATVFGRTFFRRIFNAPESIKLKEKLALIAAHRMPSEQSISEMIFRRIVQDDQSIPLTPRYDGFYRYWRHFPNEPTGNALRWGIIKIETIENMYTSFSHWSFDEIKARKFDRGGNPGGLDVFVDPEDTGYVFYSHSKLFALGFREGNIRLTIADAPSGNLKTAKFTGIVLTTKKQGSNIFSAGFVMVHSDHVQFRRRMTQQAFLDEVSVAAKAEHRIIHT